MNKTLFSEFDQVSAKQWKQKIQVDLKGADYNDALVWQSPEGINVKPFYHADDFENKPTPIPGHPTQWSIAQDVFIDGVVRPLFVAVTTTTASLYKCYTGELRHIKYPELD